MTISFSNNILHRGISKYTLECGASHHRVWASFNWSIGRITDSVDLLEPGYKLSWGFLSLEVREVE
jgi:hypothetical protein